MPPDASGRHRVVVVGAGIGGLAPVVVGDPGHIADTLQRWMAEADIDGFNLAYAVSPETFEDVVDLVVPELQRRGHDVRQQTLQVNMFTPDRAAEAIRTLDGALS